MAAFPQQRAGSRGIHGGSATGQDLSQRQELPTGSCDFHDLSLGVSAPSCGCKRFWLNTSYLHGQISDRAWCFCGHHACFHNAFSQQQNQRQQASIRSSREVGGIEERQQHEQNDPVVETDYPAPPAGFVPAQQQNDATSPKRLTGLGIQPESRSQSQSINTRIWHALNGFARQQEDGSVSEVPSTDAPSVAEEQRLVTNRTEPLQAQRQHLSMGPPVNITQNLGPTTNAEEFSATEANTPSLSGTPDFRALASSSNHTGLSPGHLQPGQITTATGPRSAHLQPQAHGSTRQTVVQDPPTAATAGTQSSALEIENLVRSYGRRLDVLESLSFSHVPVEELQERFELFDGRVLDLEQFRTEHERGHASSEPSRPESSKRRRFLPTELSSFSSDISFDGHAAAHTEAVVMATLATTSVTHPRIEALETRVTEIENAAAPSFARPWRVQVVLLPWGRNLRGIWFSSTEATQHSLKLGTQLTEEWTGAQSAPSLSFKSPDSAAWTTESIQAWASDASEWLSPKACGPSGTVFQRLACRGLVQDIELTAPDHRHLANALLTAFGKVIERSDTSADLAKRYYALAEDFVPLRKVRKSSRLRFLSSSEMITPATWTADFLDASVFMRVSDGQRRLYVTTPDAYLQSSDEAWSWPKLRRLPIFRASIDEQSAEANGSVIEACWSYSEHLDHAPSMQSSFASHGSFLATRTPDAADEEEDDTALRSASARPHHHRTLSLPSSSSAAAVAMESMPKRRVASFEASGMAPIYADEHGLDVQAKRRRISISPEAERRGVNFTPRWSREPPSPFTSEPAIEARSQGASSRNKRGNTPFAYATPHSNNQYAGQPSFLEGDDGDTEVDTDAGADQSDHGEEEWEGVDDGPDTDMHDDGQSFAHEDDIDEDDLDEGLTIYGV